MQQIKLQELKVRQCFHPGVSNLSRESIGDGPTKKVTGLEMIKEMAQHIWPPDDAALRRRVVFAVGLLIGSKLINVEVPIIFKHVVDNLNEFTGGALAMTDPTSTIATAVTTLLIGCMYVL